MSQNSALTKLHLSGNGVAEHTLRTIGTCCLTAACCCHNTPFGSTDSTPTRAVAAPDSCLESNKNGTPIHAPQEVQEVIKAQVDKFASAAREKQNRMAAVMREREETLKAELEAAVARAAELQRKLTDVQGSNEALQSQLEVRYSSRRACGALRR